MRNEVVGGFPESAFLGIWVEVVTGTSETLSTSLLSGRLYSVCLSVCQRQAASSTVCCISVQLPCMYSTAVVQCTKYCTSKD